MSPQATYGKKTAQIWKVSLARWASNLLKEGGAPQSSFCPNPNPFFQHQVESGVVLFEHEPSSFFFFFFFSLAVSKHSWGSRSCPVDPPLVFYSATCALSSSLEYSRDGLERSPVVICDLCGSVSVWTGPRRPSRSICPLVGWRERRAGPQPAASHLLCSPVSLVLRLLLSLSRLLFCLFKSYAPFSPLCCTTFVLQLSFSPINLPSSLSTRPWRSVQFVPFFFLFLFFFFFPLLFLVLLLHASLQLCSVPHRLLRRDNQTGG